MSAVKQIMWSLLTLVILASTGLYYASPTIPAKISTAVLSTTGHWINKPDLVFAKPNQPPLEIHADSAEFDQEKHRGVFEKDVRLDQGVTHLRANTVIIIGNATNQLVQAIAKGSLHLQAHFWTINQPDKPPMHAYADTIYYHPDRHLIQLVGHAHVEQDNNLFSAPEIQYDLQHQHVLSKNDGKTRTTIIFHPEQSS